MRNLGHEWRNLAEVLLCVESLEAKFRAECGPRLEDARRERIEAKRQGLREEGGLPWWLRSS